MRRKTLEIGLVMLLGAGLASAIAIAESNKDGSGFTPGGAPANHDFRSGHRMAMQGTSPDTCPADFNDDGQVDGADLSVILGAWATENCDLNLAGGSCFIDGADLSVVLGEWGPCS